MKITREQVRHVARLARIDVPEHELEPLTRELGDILSYVDTLNEADTTGTLPTYHAISLVNAFREDAPGVHLQTEQALANAPEKDDGSFIVPKVIG